MGGFSGAIGSALSSMTQSSDTTDVISGNIANSDTTSFKRAEMQALNLVNSASKTSGGVGSNIRSLIDNEGDMFRTGISTDLAIKGSGFVPVAETLLDDGTPTTVLYTRDLSFRKNELDQFVNGSGHTLLAWAVDADGNLPEAKSLPASLSPVNIKQLIAQASATTKLEFSANLKSQENVIGNGVKTINIVDRGSNDSPFNSAISDTDIIFPNASNSLTVGEGLEMRVEDKSKKIIYGGLVSSLELSNSGTDIVQNGGTKLSTDDVTILVGSITHTFTRGSGTTNLEVLENLAFQINSTNGAQAVKARVVNKGTTSVLMIAPSDPNKSMVFGGTVAFRNSVGLDDSKNTSAFTATPDSEFIGRFNSLKDLSEIFKKQNIESKSFNTESIGGAITMKSAKRIAFSNYNPVGGGSDFLNELGLNKGFLVSDYDPYDAKKNMAGKTYFPQFSRDFPVFDSMGNQHNMLIGFLKVDTNKWAVEVYAIDSSSVSIPGRTDGLLMAGYVTFDGIGKLEGFTSATQKSYSKEVGSPELAIGATAGQTLTVTIDTTTHTFRYGKMYAEGVTLSPAGTTVTDNGTTKLAADTLSVTSGATTFNFTRGAGTTDLAVLKNMVSQMNATTGVDAITAKLVYDSLSGTYKINVRPVDTTLAVSFAAGTLGTDLGLTPAKNILANSFENLYDLSEQINATQSLAGNTGLIAQVIPGSTPDVFKLSIQPKNEGLYLTFGGSSGVISPPIGTGIATTIKDALGFGDTSLGKQLTAPTEDLVINWAPTIGANANTISVFWGEPGSSEGLGQVSGQYTTKKLEQNGVSTGNLTNIDIKPDGTIVASFSNNSKPRTIYKIPVADFANPNGLISVAGNAYQIGKSSGPLNLKEAGIDGAGTFVSGSLEGSNVNIADELASLIVAQRQYQASSKVISVVDKLLEDLIHRTFNS